MKQRSLVVTDNALATAELDRVMWSFSDTSFLAHEPLNESQAAALVNIGDTNAVSSAILEQQHDVLINLASEIPIFSHHFSRIAEIVEADEASKTAARVRYKKYQGEGFVLKMHNIEL